MKHQTDIQAVEAVYDALGPYYHMFYGEARHALNEIERQVSGLLNLSNVRPGDAIDCGCGAGMQALALQNAGWKVVGVDISSNLLRHAESLRNSLELTGPRFVKADMRNLSQGMENSFDICTSFGNCLAHITDELSLESAFKSFMRVLRPGGTLMIASRDNDALLKEKPNEIDHFVKKCDGSRVIYSQTFDWAENSAVYDCNAYTIIHNSDTHKIDTIHSYATMRAWVKDELMEKAAHAGFVNVDWHGSEKTGYHNPVLIAKKP